MKSKLPMMCNVVSAILVVAFVIKCIVDYSQYSSSFNSAPFRVWVLVNALYLIAPAILVFGVGSIIKKKMTTNP